MLSGKAGEFCQPFMDFCLTHVFTNCSHQLVSEEIYLVLITENMVMQTGIQSVSQLHKEIREP